MSDQVDFTINTNMHRAFAREINRLQGALDHIDAADATAVAGLKRRFTFFSDTLHTHHEGEDRFLWPVAAARCRPEEKVVLDAMEAEHEALQASLAALDEGFAALGPETDVPALSAHFDELRHVLTGHCAHEERDGIPVVQKYITRADLKEFMGFTRSQKDSALVLPWVCDGASAREVDTTWAMLPGFVRLFVKPMTTRKYDRFTAECGI